MQTVFEDDAKIFEALCAGANGYILKIPSPVKMLEGYHRCAEWRRSIYIQL